MEEKGPPADEAGQTLLFVIIITTAVLFSVLVLIGGAQLYFQSSNASVMDEKALNLAEAGVDKAIVAINKNENYSGEDSQFGDGEFSVSVTSKDANTKLIESKGFIPSQDHPKAKKQVKIQAIKGLNIPFLYGIQAGAGGLTTSNQVDIKGNIYSNNSITFGDSNITTGNVWVAGGASLTVDQQTDCDGGNCSDFIFGKTVNGDEKLDVAQKFKAGSTSALSKVSLKLKKVGSPGNIWLRILADNNGPDKNHVLSSTLLQASTVGSEYSFVDVNIQPINLTADISYWLMLDTSNDSSNYWVWQEDLAGSYSRGNPAWSPDWSGTTWTNLSSDLSFKTYIGSGETFVRGGSSVTVSGNVYANTIDHLTIQGDAFYKIITQSTVSGSSHPDSTDPLAKVLPISEQNISDWKTQAEAVGISSGDITSCQNLSGKIDGNIILEDGCNIEVTAPVWITGDVVLGNNNNLTLQGDVSGVLIIDGKLSLLSSNKFSGGEGNFLVIVSTNTSKDSEDPAVFFASSGNSADVVVAEDGLINAGNSSFKQLTGWGIANLDGMHLNYAAGLASTIFTGSNTSSYSLIKGTYQVK